jgi:hypothetical protein
MLTVTGIHQESYAELVGLGETGPGRIARLHIFLNDYHLMIINNGIYE